jgi:hypothetical protein
VDVLEPHDRSRPAQLHFRGRPSQRDFTVMSAALQAAMQPRRSGPLEVRFSSIVRRLLSLLRLFLGARCRTARHTTPAAPLRKGCPLLAPMLCWQVGS